MAFSARVKGYWELTKAGLVFGNLITVIAGFALGIAAPVAAGAVTGAAWPSFVAVCVGMFLVMASGCAFNNYIDRDIDGLMVRTKDRVLVRGRMSPRAALVFAGVLGVLGFVALALWTGPWPLAAAAVGFFFYVVAYSMWAKRGTVHGTVVGSISGAVPPVVGYAAASGRIDGGALLLFLIMVVWQMPHFYAIAIRRASDYAAANVPVLPVAAGLRTTKVQIIFYIVAFAIATHLLAVFHYEDLTYAVIAALLSLAWLALGSKGFFIPNAGHAANIRWARQMFFFSLIVMVVLFATIIFTSLLA